LHCSPNASGTFTLKQLQRLFGEIRRLDSVTEVYYEGGEAFLYFPLLSEGVRMARAQGLDVGTVSNGYWATGIEDAKLWLRPLIEHGLTGLSVSNDTFHYSGEGPNPAEAAFAAAEQLGMPVDTIRIDEPAVIPASREGGAEKGAPVIGGNVMMRGRAVEKLTDGLPRRPWQDLTSCPHEELEHPKRVHVDSFGHVHICQGLSMGNMWKIPFAEMIESYRAQDHPICRPLVEGGPAALAQEYGVAHEDGYVDECHFCYRVRQALIDRFPEWLAPRQVYGL
jgi:hypothetical protein